MMDNLVAFYLCNKERFCTKDGWCGVGMCNHTTDIRFANDNSIRIFKEFKDRFEIHADEDGRFYAVEKEK